MLQYTYMGIKFLNIKPLLMIFVLCLFINATFAQSREDLQNELKKLEAEIELHKNNIDQKQKEGKTLQRDISILDSKIKKTEAEIKARDQSIRSLLSDIRTKEEKISDLNIKLERDKDYISNTFRQMEMSKSDNFTLLLLSQDNFSKAVDNVNNLNNIKKSLVITIENVKTTKNILEGVKKELEENKEKEESIKSEQIVKKKEIAEDKQEKNEILKVTKGEEKLYQQKLANTEQKAKEIRSKLYTFQDGSQVNFGNLYEYAKNASAATGVRTEFILAILEQESAFGANVGQCYMADDSGKLINIKSGAERGKMKPDSIQPFNSITSSLGRDKNQTRVSCALSYGYGGAMGMSQFMPATWIGFKSRIEDATGAPIADPWNAYHAITGTAFLLKQDGASKQTYQDERTAACRYYSGGSCSRSSAAANYGNQVMSRIQSIQNRINVLKNN